MNLLGGLKVMFGYDAVDSVKKRRQASISTQSEDSILSPAKRKQLQAQADDCLRNFVLCKWILEKHLDFCSRFGFSSQTGDDRFDYEFQDLMTEWMNEPKLCDIAGRHTLNRVVRMTDANAVVRGDHVLAKLATGHIQQIESDRIRDLVGSVTENMVHGVNVNDQSAAVSYEIWRRRRMGGYEYEGQLKAEDALFHGYYPSYRSDQVRGIPLITPGLNSMIDAYEWHDLTMATAKLRTMIGLIITSDMADGAGVNTYQDDPEQIGDDDESCDVEGDSSKKKYDVELGAGPFKMELEKGDDAKFLKDESPSAETFQFVQSCIGMSLKSLDIPYCFWDESYATFAGNRAALILYIESCKVKRDNLRSNILRPLTIWKAKQWVAQKRLRLPPNGNLDRLPFAWHPAGTPYWNPQQDINADIQLLGAGLANWEDLYLERTGRDWEADTLRRKEQEQFLKKHEIVLNPQVMPIIQVASDLIETGKPVAKNSKASGIAV